MKKFILWTSYSNSYWSGSTWTYNPPTPYKMAEFIAFSTEIKDGLVRFVNFDWGTIGVVRLADGQWITSEEISN